jgi:uncharacterized protein with von Willebrand factor type A (vWA) domain
MTPGLIAFANDLRAAGIAVSTSEVMDAARALERTGVGDRRVVRSVLAACMVKSMDHRRLFDAMFDDAFPMVRDEEPTGDLSVLFDEGGHAAVKAAVAQLAGMQDGRFFGVDYHAERVMRRLQAIGIAVAEPSDAIRFSALSRAVSEEVERQAPPGKIVDELQRQRPEAMEFLRMTPGDEAVMRRAAEDLARRLAARTRRVRHGRKGVLLPRQTVRRSLSTGGALFDPVFRPRRRHVPQLVVMADVSGSVAGFARFTLHVMHTLTNLRRNANLRTFVFVDDIDEVTTYFRRSLDVRSAVAAIDASARVNGDRGHSDYGRVFESFAANYVRSLHKSATVLILGDARSNYHEVNTPALKAIAQAVRNVYWLNPEPDAHWNTADSVAAQYAQECDDMVECRNATQLADVVRRLPL